MSCPSPIPPASTTMSEFDHSAAVATTPFPLQEPSPRRPRIPVPIRSTSSPLSTASASTPIRNFSLPLRSFVPGRSSPTNTATTVSPSPPASPTQGAKIPYSNRIPYRPAANNLYRLPSAIGSCSTLQLSARPTPDARSTSPSPSSPSEADLVTQERITLVTSSDAQTCQPVAAFHKCEESFRKSDNTPLSPSCRSAQDLADFHEAVMNAKGRSKEVDLKVCITRQPYAIAKSVGIFEHQERIDEADYRQRLKRLGETATQLDTIQDESKPSSTSGGAEGETRYVESPMSSSRSSQELQRSSLMGNVSVPDTLSTPGTPNFSAIESHSPDDSSIPDPQSHQIPAIPSSTARTPRQQTQDMIPVARTTDGIRILKQRTIFPFLLSTPLPTSSTRTAASSSNRRRSRRTPLQQEERQGSTYVPSTQSTRRSTSSIGANGATSATLLDNIIDSADATATTLSPEVYRPQSRDELPVPVQVNEKTRSSVPLWRLDWLKDRCFYPRLAVTAIFLILVIVALVSFARTKVHTAVASDLLAAAPKTIMSDDGDLTMSWLANDTLVLTINPSFNITLQEEEQFPTTFQLHLEWSVDGMQDLGLTPRSDIPPPDCVPVAPFWMRVVELMGFVGVFFATHFVGRLGLEMLSSRWHRREDGNLYLTRHALRWFDVARGAVGLLLSTLVSASLWTAVSRALLLRHV